MICINSIATPRNISTALMYSFAQRPDTHVVDEPFYACYLVKTGVQHPGRPDIIASQPNEPAGVIEHIMTRDAAVVYIKNMAHHLRYVALERILDWRPVFLIRHPRLLISSFSKVIDNPTMGDIGSADQAAQFRYFVSRGLNPVVIDSTELLSNPEFVLGELCSRLGIPFYGEMLRWKAGPRPEDGVWARYWYESVHRSTEFVRSSGEKSELPEHCLPLYRAAMPNYDYLFSHAIKA